MGVVADGVGLGDAGLGDDVPDGVDVPVGDGLAVFDGVAVREGVTVRRGVGDDDRGASEGGAVGDGE